MRIELNVGDFLDACGARRAAIASPSSTSPARRDPSATVTYGSLARRAAPARGARSTSSASPQGARVAIVSPNSARFLVSYFGVSGYGRVLVPINFRLNAHEVALHRRHSGADVVLFDPEFALARRRASTCAPRAPSTASPTRRGSTRATADLPAPRRRRPSEDATCSINYTSGTTASPKGVQLTHRNCWLNAASFGWHLGVGDRDVLLHTLPMFHANGWGMPYAATAMAARHVVLRKVDGEEILAPRRRARASRSCAARPRSSPWSSTRPRRDAAAGREVPGAARVRIVVAGAPPPRRTIERVETELGWEFIQIYGLTETSPLLTINRAPREWDGARPEGACLACSAALASPRSASRSPSTSTARSSRGRTTCSRATGTSRRDRPGARGRLVPHRRRRLPRRSVHRDHRPAQGRDHHRRGERELDRGRGLPVPASCGRRGRGHRRARRDLGRGREGARGPPRGPRPPPRPSSSRTAAAPSRTSRRRTPSSSATSSRAPRRASSRSSSCASPTGPGHDRAVN